MVVGIDTYRENNQTAVGFVSSTNGSHPQKINCTKWFSQSSIQPISQNFISNLTQFMIRKSIVALFSARIN
jgi:hypothetical protein